MEQSENPTRPVIVAEDDAGNRMILCRMLERLGCEITRAVNGEQAVRHAKAGVAKIVFMDLNMPGMDGYEAIRLIRAEPDLAGLCVVAVTGDVTASARDACDQAGFDMVLAKPVRMEALAALLERL